MQGGCGRVGAPVCGRSQPLGDSGGRLSASTGQGSRGTKHLSLCKAVAGLEESGLATPQPVPDEPGRTTPGAKL